MARKYEQGRRADAAALTRARILDAALGQLRRTPTEPVSLNTVASAAGVARQTLYAIFGSREALFAAVGDELLRRAGFSEVLNAAADHDSVSGMRTGVRQIAQVYAKERDVLRALHSSSHLDPSSFGGAIERMERGRYIGMATLAHRLHEQGRLVPETNQALAADILWLITSFDSFDLLFTGRGLSAVETAEHLIVIAERTLLRTTSSR